MRTCEDCLYYFNPMPHTVVCIGGKRVKEYAEIKTNCKKWVKNTPENASKELEKNKRR